MSGPVLMAASGRIRAGVDGRHFLMICLQHPRGGDDVSLGEASLGSGQGALVPARTETSQTAQACQKLSFSVRCPFGYFLPPRTALVFFSDSLVPANLFSRNAQIGSEEFALICSGE
jgi:hypothetical protein